MSVVAPSFDAVVSLWLTDYMHGVRCTSPRTHLASQLRRIRSVQGNEGALSFAAAVRRYVKLSKRRPINGPELIVALMRKAQARRDYYKSIGWNVSDVSIGWSGREGLIAESGGSYRYYVNSIGGISSQSLGGPSKLAEFISTDIECDRVATNL